MCDDSGDRIAEFEAYQIVISLSEWDATACRTLVCVTNCTRNSELIKCECVFMDGAFKYTLFASRKKMLGEVRDRNDIF